MQPDGTQLGLPYVWRYADKEPLGGAFYGPIDGEFWPEKLTPPTV
jgi:hypothetical protein